MPFYPDFITSAHSVELPQPDGRILACYSGVAVFNFCGTGSTVRRDDLYIPVGRKWSSVDGACPTASLASISNWDHAVNALWAVDSCKWTIMGQKILLQCRLAVRDVDGCIHRVAYRVTAIGRP